MPGLYGQRPTGSVCQGCSVIIRELPNGQLLCINQTTPALMAEEFCCHWGNQDFARPVPYSVVMLGCSTDKSPRISSYLPAESEEIEETKEIGRLRPDVSLLRITAHP